MSIHAVPVQEPDFTPDVDYLEFPDLANVANGLIRRNDVHFRDLAQLRIVYLRRLGDRSGEGEAAIAKCQKAPAIWRDTAGIDVAIWVWDEVWAELDTRQREALTAHELCHVSVTEKGTVKLLPHDLEEFAWVARQYGAWDTATRIFAEQLRAFDEPISLQDKKPQDGDPVTTHDLILAIALAWAGLDIAFLWAMLRHARLRDEAVIRRRLQDIADETRLAHQRHWLRALR